MVKIQVFLENGVVKEYEVETESQAMEHSHRIVTEGYHSFDKAKKLLVVYPPSRVYKVKVFPFEGGHYCDKTI